MNSASFLIEILRAVLIKVITNAMTTPNIETIKYYIAKSTLSASPFTFSFNSLDLAF